MPNIWQNVLLTFQVVTGQMLDKFIILGYSGHAYSVIEAIQSNEQIVHGYCESQKQEKNPFQLEYIGNEKNIDLNSFKSENVFFPCIGDPKIREQLVEFILTRQLKQTNVIHKNAYISQSVKLGNSVFIGNGVIINPAVDIGNGAIINTRALVEHECYISDFVHVAPGAILGGNVKIGKSSLIGIGSVVRPGIKIGKNCIIGAGSVVVTDIEDGMVYAGNPAKRIKKNE